MKSFVPIRLTLLAGALVLVAAVLFPGRVVEAEGGGLVIIANKSLPAGEISKGELKAIFLKQKTSFEGERVIPINAKDGTDLRKAFQSRVLEMDDSEEKAFWEEEKIKTSRGAPAEFRNTLKAVFSVKGAVGYCLKSEYREGVVQVLGEL